MTTRRQPVAFRDVTVEQRLAERTEEGSLGLTALRDLERYYALLPAALEEVASIFTLAEKIALCDVANGVLWETAGVPLVWTEVADADRGQVEQWGVNREVLVDKVKSLTIAQTYALVDALERLRLSDVTGNHKRLAAVGLL